MKELKGHRFEVRTLCFAPNGEKAYSAGMENEIREWDLTTGQQTRILQGFVRPVTSLTVSGDGRYLATGRFWDTFPVWDIPGLRELPLLGGGKNDLGHSNTYEQVAFTSDSSVVLAAGVNNKSVQLWNVRDGKLADAFGFPTGGFLRLSADGSTLLLGHGTTITLREIISGRTLEIDARDHIEGLDLSRDGKRLLSVQNTPDAEGYPANGVVRLWEVQTGEKIGEFHGESQNSWYNQIYAVCLSSDGGTAAVAWQGGLITLHELPGGKKIRELPGHLHTAYSLSFSRDGRFLLSGGADHTVRLWDTSSGKCVRVFAGHTSYVIAVSFMPDGRSPISASSDGTVRIWNPTTGGFVGFVSAASLSLPEPSDWLIYTDDGYFDGSRGGADMVAVVKGRETFRVDQFAVVKNRPDIILRRLGVGTPDQIDNYFAQYLKRIVKMNFLPLRIPSAVMQTRILKGAQSDEERTRILAAYSVQGAEYSLKEGLTYTEKLQLLRVPSYLAYIEESVLSGDLHVPVSRILDLRKEGKQAILSLELADDRYNLKSYSVFVNDVPLFGAYGKPVAGSRQRIVEHLELSAGINKIEVSCLNEKGAESFRAVSQLEYEQPVAERLYFLGFGVSRYKSPELNLNYADKDVQDLAAAFQRMQGGKFKEVRVRTYLNEEATSSAVTQAKDFLKDAGVDDTLVLFISGHGTHDSDSAATYYYLTYETNVRDLAHSAADFDRIEELLQGIGPRKKLFLMDTCESGDVEEDVSGQAIQKAGGRGMKPRTSPELRKPQTKGLSVTTVAPRTFLGDRNRFIYTDLLRRSGSIVFSSCRGGEFSYESDAIRNGFFTSEILRALSQRVGDNEANKSITVDELRAYVSDTVPKLTDDLQHPTVDRDNRTQEIDFPRSVQQ